MRRPLIVIFLLVLLCACGNREKYARLLAEADSLNQNYIPFTTDSTMKEVVDYYDRHGTANERMRAYYLLGCVYRDLGEAPHALECYHDAVDCADTTARDCDYEMLAKIHGQAAMIFHDQALPENMLSELDEAIHFACLAKDTLGVYNYLSNKVGGYSLLGQTDSVRIVTEQVSALYAAYGDTISANTVLGPAIHCYLLQGNYNKARRYLERYEYHSMLSEYDHFPYAPWKLLYSMKARYYKGVGILDSTEYYYRKQITESTDLNNLEIAYKGLYDLFKDAGKTDSIRKYADLYTEINDSSVKELSTTSVLQMQSLYNYSRHQRLAKQAEIKKANAEKRNYILASTILLLLLLCYIIVIKIKKAKEREYNIMKRQLEDDIHLLEDTKSEMEALMQKNSEEYASDIQEKSALIQQLKAKIQESAEHQRRMHTVDIENLLMNSHIYRKFRAYADKPLKRPTLKDWSNLRSLINREIPSFYAYLVLQHNIGISDFDMYILFRLRFHLSEISNLTGLKLSTISAKRKRLYFSIFQKDCSSDEFIAFLTNIE